MKDKFAKNTEQFIKVAIMILWTIIMLFIMGTCMLFNVDLTGELNVHYSRDSIIMNLVWITAAYIIFTVIYRICRKHSDSRIIAWFSKNKMNICCIVTAAVAIMLIIWIFMVKFEPVTDQLYGLQIGGELLKGEYNAWNRGGYMDIYPFQNDFILFDAVLVKIFGSNAYIAFQVINVFFYIVAVVNMYITCRYMFRRNNSVAIWLACVLFYPFAIYVIFCYGIIIGFALAQTAVMFLYRYFDRHRLTDALLCAVMIRLAMMIKTNYSIFLVGICLYLLLDIFIKKRTKNIAAILIIATITVAGQYADKSLFRYFTGIELSKGMPKVTWVAMGLNDYGNAPGWYDGYSVYTYNKNNQDYDETSKEAVVHIKQRMQLLTSSGKKFCRFFVKKLSSEWNNPAWECFDIQNRPTHTAHIRAVEAVSDDNNGIYKDILNVVQTLLNFGIIMYISYKWKNINELQIYELFNAVIMMGAFVFYMFWEAKSQYTLPYYYLLIPYAVMGWQQLIRGKNNGKTS